jgi:hypothetical protein
LYFIYINEREKSFNKNIYKRIPTITINKAPSASMSKLVETKVADFLENDDPVRGQNYVCLSFLSPEDVIRSKESYYLRGFFREYVRRNKELYDGLAVLFPEKQSELESIMDQYSIYFESDIDKLNDEYKSFKKDNEASVTKEFSDENDFQTSVRGLKVRGSYETLGEAQARAEILRIKDRNLHNIYVAEVGCWCPWDANPDEIQNAEYTETQLNTLMKEYKKNKQLKDAFYNERKQEMMTKLFEEENIKRQKSAITTIEEEHETHKTEKTTEPLVANDDIETL